MIYDVQKANVLKRASAFLLDIILIAVLAVGFMALLSVICDYDGHYKAYASIVSEVEQNVIDEYKVSHGVDLSISEDDYNNLSQEEKDRFDEVQEIASTDFNERLVANEDFGKEYMLSFTLSIMMTSVGIFLSVLILEFIIPLFLKNGQTVGKKVFGIAVMHTNGVRVRPFSMFVRAILGKYVFEIMVPVLLALMMFFGVLNILVGIIVLALFLILQIGVFIYTRNKTRSFLHDLMSRTVAVDLASQMIFENEEELLEFKKQEQMELAARNDYRENGGFDFYNSSLNYRGGKKIVDNESDSPTTESCDSANDTVEQPVEESGADDNA